MNAEQSGGFRASSDPMRSGTDYLHAFHAMATPCEVRLETDDADLARQAGAAVEAEARRIEAKYSRYRVDSVVGKINGARGAEIVVDAETGHLLDFAAQCYAVSGGLFDITSGVLRRIWRFDGSDRIPTVEQIRQLRSLVGWHRVTWSSPAIVLPAGMELDLGGLAKEYAVDRALAALRAVTNSPSLVNFGGDLAVTGPRRNGESWNVAIENVEKTGEMAAMLELSNGALATSGDMRRYLLKDGVRYGHILDPQTACPVIDAPRSVTVAAATCVQAGMTATLAMLHGRRAEVFLRKEGIRAWCIR